MERVKARDEIMLKSVLEYVGWIPRSHFSCGDFSKTKLIMGTTALWLIKCSNYSWKLRRYNQCLGLFPRFLKFFLCLDILCLTYSELIKNYKTRVMHHKIPHKIPYRTVYLPPLGPTGENGFISKTFRKWA